MAEMNEVYCVNGCDKPAIGEQSIGILMEGPDDFAEVAELLCEDCLN